MLPWQFSTIIALATAKFSGAQKNFFILSGCWLKLCTDIAYNQLAMRIILKLMVSLKSAVALISFLTLLSMIGTLVPQNLDAVNYIKEFPRIGHWIVVLGFDDMYRSVLFQTCLWLLALSTVACIMTRWKSTSRKLFGRLQNASEKEIRAFDCGRIVHKPIVENWVKFFPTQKTDENGALIHLTISGKMSLLGGMSIHLGLLAILGGALIGMFYGVETAIRGGVGEKVVVAPLNAVRAARDADRISREARNIRNFSPEDPRLEDMRVQVEKLHQIYNEGMASPAFKIAFDELWVDYYDGPDGQNRGIKGWNSKVRFIEGDSQTEPVIVKVNQPVTHRDFTFYQASWNKTFRKIRVKVELMEGASGQLPAFLASPASFPLFLDLKLNEAVRPEWSAVDFILHDFLPDFRIIGERFVSVSQELNNPAARIAAYAADGNIAGRAWAFPHDRVMQASHVSNMPFLFTFAEAEPEFESGMQMAYDPGKPLVWLGCLLFTIGMIFSFYIPYRETWLIVYPDGHIRLAISGNRPATIFAADLDRLEAQLTSNSQESINHE